MAQCKIKWLVGLLAVLVASLCGVVQAEVSPFVAARAILESKCIECHGGNSERANLNLSSHESLLRGGETGPAIVAGDAKASLLYKKITHADEPGMPYNREKLSEDEIAQLAKWINAGAIYEQPLIAKVEKIWSLQPLKKSAPPKTKNKSWAKTPIDQFILAKLEEKGMKPSPMADKRTLLRRVTFDLIGLPPTPEEMREFLNDKSTNAFTKVVDCLLASPRYGERWARHWLDVVHYADTHGHDQDRPRPNAWPYRDYLIQSFNEDNPYAQFVEEQIAGDVLFPNKPDGVIALGFLAAGPWDLSSQMAIMDDTDDKKIARYLDRDDMIMTTMSTFVSSTVHCARCHNHKFDPISQKEYYNLQAVFAGVDRVDRPYDLDSTIHTMRQALLKKKTALDVKDKKFFATLLQSEMQDKIAAWETTISGEGIWTVLDPTSFSSSSGATLTKQKDFSLLASGIAPLTDVYTITANTDLKNITAIRLELQTDASHPRNGPGRQPENGNSKLSEIKLSVAPQVDGRARHSVRAGAESAKNGEQVSKASADFLPHPARNERGEGFSEKPTSSPQPSPPSDGREGENSRANNEPRFVALQNPSADFSQKDWEIHKALDGDTNTAWGIFPETGKAHFAVFELKEDLGFKDGTTLTFTLEQLHGREHTFLRPRISVTTAPRPVRAESLPENVRKILSISALERTDEQRTELAAFYLQKEIEKELAALPKPKSVYAVASDFVPQSNFKPAKMPRPVHLLKRGNINKPGELALPGALACVPDLNAQFEIADANDEGSRRAALAKWISDPKNVLTWRSIVNRVWHYHFGRGIVDTPNDFGEMGSRPTHPELLDWLAVTFLESGGSIKQLHKLILTSTVYQQSSAHNEKFAQIDSGNSFLWRMNRARLDAEEIRDAILQMTGKLDLKMGGPSVMQFQMDDPNPDLTPKVDYAQFDVDSPLSFRRSVYRYIFRTLPDPFMDTLDCADASQLTPVRNISMTALQALAMWNDAFVLRQSEHLAARVAKTSDKIEKQIEAIYKLALNRAPSRGELKVMKIYATEHGMANACRVILNSNEFMFVN